MTAPTDADYTRAADLIANAGALLVCAGAGMGVDSGLPDFRGDEGFWRAYPPYARLGFRFTELADPEHFATDPELAWGFYGHRLSLYRRTVPHEGFDLLRQWGDGLDGGAAVFTSNVDGHFQRAGFDTVAEVHGSIHHLQCSTGCSGAVWPAEDAVVDIDEATMRACSQLPRCERCGAVARPNILMFGDADWVPNRSQRQLDALREWQARQRNVVVVELGAGLAIPTVRWHAESASIDTGALVRINPREPETPGGKGVSLGVGALEALREIDVRL